MGTTQPIKNKNDINRLKDYFLQKGELRNYTMITLALNTSLRIGDLLQLKWEDVYNFELRRYKIHIIVLEQKTHKYNMIPLNPEAKHSLEILKRSLPDLEPGHCIFKSRIGKNRPIGRSRAFNIIKNAVKELNIEGSISCHSLRKTFGYQAWKKGVPPALIMSIYNHSSLEITKRYLSIDQDDKDEVFLNMNL